MNRAASFVLTHPSFLRAAFALSRRAAPIFMFHRFADAEAGNEGHDPQVLRANLSWLRSNNCSMLPVTELLDRLAAGESTERAVAFTVDDGYADFARVAAPVFAEFDCPVTVFLTTGFLDGHHWMWWDQVAVALTALRRDGEIPSMTEALKLIPESERQERIGQLIQDSGVEMPPTPTPAFAPLAWDDVRRLSRAGVTFGPHSVTHPVFSRTGDEQSRFEIVESWRRVRAEAGDGAVPVFCYPNGGPADFGAREESTIAGEGMQAALTTMSGYVSRRDFSVDQPSRRFKLRRCGYSDDPLAFKQVATGIERAKGAVRAAFK
jgi:peptidoglycan/xylan/chitin deacetylase (PgdA/CDA1 family)